MNEEEKKAIEKFKTLNIKHFNEETIYESDLLSYYDGILILNLIDKLQEELENRIPRKDIEEEINKLQEHKMDILGSPIHNANEKLRMIKKNTIRIETLEHLLKKWNKE